MDINFKQMIRDHISTQVIRFQNNYIANRGTSFIHIGENFVVGYIKLLVARLENMGWSFLIVDGVDEIPILRGYHLKNHLEWMLSKVLDGNGAYEWSFYPTRMDKQWLASLQEKLEETGCNVSRSGSSNWTIEISKEVIEMMMEK